MSFDEDMKRVDSNMRKVGRNLTITAWLLTFVAACWVAVVAVRVWKMFHA